MIFLWKHNYLNNKCNYLKFSTVRMEATICRLYMYIICIIRIGRVSNAKPVFHKIDFCSQIIRVTAPRDSSNSPGCVRALICAYKSCIVAQLSFVQLKCKSSSRFLRDLPSYLSQNFPDPRLTFLKRTKSKYLFIEINFFYTFNLNFIIRLYTSAIIYLIYQIIYVLIIITFIIERF